VRTEADEVVISLTIPARFPDRPTPIRAKLAWFGAFAGRPALCSTAGCRLAFSASRKRHMRIIRCCGLVFLAWLAGTSHAEARQCLYTLTPTSFSVGSTAGLRTLSIVTGTQCSWTAVSAASWITVTDGAAGSGIGSVTIAVQENPGGAPRTGTLTIAGQTVTVIQQAGSCTVSVTPTSFTVAPISGTRTVSIVAGTQCAWSSTPQAAWISVKSGASGSGIGAVTFDFEGNPSSTPRTGVLTIGGQSVTITQGASGGGPAPSAPANLRIVR
jgi:hypothetical protein